MRVSASCLALSLLAGPALAQVPAPGPGKEAIAGLTGQYEISNADHDQICPVTLRADPGPGGFRLDFNRADCAGKFPPLKDVTAWTLVGDDTVKLTDRAGRVYYEFTQVENGLYESLRPGQPLTFLQTAASAAELTRTVEQLTGDWGVVRNAGDPVCVFTLINAPAATVGDLQIQVKPGCDKGIAAFAPTAWQMDKGELVLKNARAQLWRFAESNGMWLRVPEGREAISLIKQEPPQPQQ
jgi:hypothetical protein